MPKVSRIMKYRHDRAHPVYGQTGSPTGDVNIFTRRYGAMRRRLNGQARHLQELRQKELELLEEMGKLDRYGARELAKLRVTACNKV